MYEGMEKRKTAEEAEGPDMHEEEMTAGASASDGTTRESKDNEATEGLTEKEMKCFFM